MKTLIIKIDLKDDENEKEFINTLHYSLDRYSTHSPNEHGRVLAKEWLERALVARPTNLGAAVPYYDDYMGEWVVRAYDKGMCRKPSADYHALDEKDARGTALAMMWKYVAEVRP